MKHFLGKECLIFTDYNKVFEVIIDKVDREGYYIEITSQFLKENLSEDVIEKLNLNLDDGEHSTMFIPKNRVLLIIYGDDKRMNLASAVSQFPHLERVFVDDKK